MATMAVAGVAANGLISSISFSSTISGHRLPSLHQPATRFCSLTGKIVAPVPHDSSIRASSHFASSLNFRTKEECSVVAHVVAEALTGEVEVAEVTVPSDDLSKLKLESDLLKKKIKRAELRRKRLVRKRHLRKKGRWPPSKMAKNKNV